MEPDKNIEKELAELIADPQKVSAAHTAMLNELLQEYPYYQPLHLLLAKAGEPETTNHHLATASLYTSGHLLHQFLFRKKITEGNFRIIHGKEAMKGAAPAQDMADEIPCPPVADEQEVFEEISEQQPVFQLEPMPATPEEDEETYDEISEIDINDYRPFRNSDEAPSPENEDPEGTYDEISEIDFNDYRPFSNSKEIKPEEADSDEGPYEEISEINLSDYPSSRPAPVQVPEPEKAAEREVTGTYQPALKDDFVYESIVSSDFFAFEDNFSPVQATEEEQAEKAPQEPPYIEEHDEAAAAEVENSQVSNYHDEKLPYTFLWWLAKTRKEHQESFQPYALPKKGNSQELQQQYVEHIFHMQTHITANDALLDEEGHTRPVTKDFEIIDNFIKKDPQILPPNAEQIDTENKAKKSAEDQNDLVSETLANIYIEQMLYDKAIDTYEKLSLKFPEKSRYFADLIQSIEKKI